MIHHSEITGNGFMLNDGIVNLESDAGDFQSAYEALLRNDEVSFLLYVEKLEPPALAISTRENGTLLHLICKSSLSDKAFFALLNKQPQGFRCDHMGCDQAATAFMNRKVNWQKAIQLKENMPALTFQI